MRVRKKTGVHGNDFKKLLCKTLNSRMNIIETRAVLNIVNIDGKWAFSANKSIDEKCLNPF